MTVLAGLETIAIVLVMVFGVWVLVTERAVRIINDLDGRDDDAASAPKEG